MSRLPALAIALALLPASARAEVGDQWDLLRTPSSSQFLPNSARNFRAPPADIVAMVSSAASAAGVPLAIALAVVRHESGYRANARGRAGEIGLMQIKYATARGMGYAGSAAGLYDPSTNLTFGMRYLRTALDRGGSGCSGIALYQRGVYGRASCSSYGRKVLAGMR